MDEVEYPVKTQLPGREFVGELSYQPLPPFETPPLPGMMVGLTTETDEYVLYIPDTSTWDFPVEVAGQDLTLYEGDMVKVVGSAYEEQLSAEKRAYRAIRAETITLLERGEAYEWMEEHGWL